MKRTKTQLNKIEKIKNKIDKEKEKYFSTNGLFGIETKKYTGIYSDEKIKEIIDKENKKNDVLLKGLIKNYKEIFDIYNSEFQDMLLMKYGSIFKCTNYNKRKEKFLNNVLRNIDYMKQIISLTKRIYTSQIYKIEINYYEQFYWDDQQREYILSYVIKHLENVFDEGHKILDEKSLYLNKIQKIVNKEIHIDNTDTNKYVIFSEINTSEEEKIWREDLIKLICKNGGI